MTDTEVGEGTSRRDTVLGLVTRPSGWRRIRLFGASRRAGRTRRRTDLISLIVTLLALALVTSTARDTNGLEAALLDTIEQLPSFFDPIWAITYDLLALWAIGALLAAMVRRQWGLTWSLVLSVPVALGLTAIVDWGLDATGTFSLGAPVEGSPAQLAASMAMASIASREMSRPFRATGRRLVQAAMLGALLLPVATPLRVVCALLVANATSSTIRLLLGSPVTTVGAHDAEEDLADLGIAAVPVVGWADGDHTAVMSDGQRLDVEILDRDAWEGQLAVGLWRRVWYRRSFGQMRVTPRQHIEHQALLLLLAQTKGVPVTRVATAGTSATGDALLACHVEGPTLAETQTDAVDDAFLASCWSALDALHDAGIAHGAISPDAIQRGPDDLAVLADFDHAHVLVEPPQVHIDRAGLLVTTALVVGHERAIDAAVRRLGTDADAIAPLVSCLQVAALGEDLRDRIKDAGLSLDDLRAQVAERAGIDEPELQKIWRVTWGAVLRLALLAFVAYLLISQLADIGWDTIWDAITSANPVILAIALVFGQVPRVAQAASLRTASPVPVELRRVTQLQFAMSFVNLAVPSTAARVGVSIRFFQRSGATPTGAVSAGAVDSVSGFIAQITLLGGLVLAGFGTLGWSDEAKQNIDTSDILKWVGIFLGLVAIAAAVVLLVPRLRAFAVHIWGQLGEALAVLRSPGAVVRLYGFNVLAELLFSTTIWIVLQAFGQDVAFADVVIINEAVALFAGLVPVPGGVGVTEGAITAGLVAVGVDQSVAFSVALCYRMCTFYLPPIWGYFAFSALRRDGYL